MTNSQHSKASWIDAGFSALISGGALALRAEPLAKTLGTTKGSFYWHFADVPTFHIAMIDHWRNDALTKIVTQLSESGTPESRLRVFGEQILSDPSDQAMRAWSQSHPYLANTIEQVDEQRLIYVSTLLTSLGVSNPAFSLACYGALIGSKTVQSDTTPLEAFTALIDLILALK
jgi:AcrR family transcriptional regulator